MRDKKLEQLKESWGRMNEAPSKYFRVGYENSAMQDTHWAFVKAADEDAAIAKVEKMDDRAGMFRVEEISKEEYKEYKDNPHQYGSRNDGAPSSTSSYGPKLDELILRHAERYHHHLMGGGSGAMPFGEWIEGALWGMEHPKSGDKAFIEEIIGSIKEKSKELAK